MEAFPVQLLFIIPMNVEMRAGDIRVSVHSALLSGTGLTVPSSLGSELQDVYHGGYNTDVT